MNGTPIQTKDCVEYVDDPRNSKKKIKRFIRFIPASYKDNPFLNTSYVANLQALPEHQKQLDMYGNQSCLLYPFRQSAGLALAS